MQPIPETISKQFRRRLGEVQINAQYVPHYLKWLRYYWDFCHQYGKDVNSLASLEPFIDKLKSKGQSPALLVQASKAVRLYRELSVNEAEPSQMGNGSAARVVQSPKFDPAWQQVLSSLEAEIKLRQYSRKTLQTYVAWVRRFREFSGAEPVASISAESAKMFLTSLAVERGVAASTQNQAFNALLFLFRHVLKKDYELGDSVTRAKTSKYIPTVLTREELEKVLAGLEFPFDLIASVLYGCGLRLSECLNLRINCLDFSSDLVIVHDGKGRKDRSVPMPRKLKADLQAQATRVGKLLDRDLCQPDFGGTFLPNSIANKSKAAGKDLGWQWLFPAKTLTLVPDEGCYRRYHNYDKNVGRAIRVATRRAKIAKRVTAHTFRHTFASHLLQANVDLRTIQQLLGHADIRTTMIYTHTVQSRTLKEMVSPMDLYDSPE
jgi:integron integrase